jgi:hypothetical protein
MFAFLLLTVLSADTDGDAMRAPRVLKEEYGSYAMAADDRHLYTQTVNGIFAWDRRDNRRLVAPLSGDRNTALVSDRDFVYVISREALWRAPKPGITGKPQRLAATGSSLGLAVDSAWVYFPDAETAQLFRVAKTGGTPTPMVTGPVEKTGTTVSEDGQGVIVDGSFVYWTFAGKILRVPRAGGPAQVLFQSPTLAPLSLAADDAGLYFGADKQTYRLRKTDGGVPEPVLDCLAEHTQLAGDWIYATCDKRLLRVSRDLRRRELLDEGPTDKMALAVDEQRVYFADDSSGTIAASLLALSLDEKPVTGKGKPSFEEASLAIRRWLHELGAKDGTPRLLVPLQVHLGPDLQEGFRLDVTVNDQTRLQQLATDLRERKHPILDFDSRFAWRALSPAENRSDWRKKKRRMFRSRPGEFILISHRESGNCPYAEVVVALVRVGKDLVPRRLYFEADYECE